MPPKGSHVPAFGPKITVQCGEVACGSSKRWSLAGKSGSLGVGEFGVLSLSLGFLVISKVGKQQLAPAATHGQGSLGHNRDSTFFSAPVFHCIRYFSSVHDHTPSKKQFKEGWTDFGSWSVVVEEHRRGGTFTMSWHCFQFNVGL